MKLFHRLGAAASARAVAVAAIVVAAVAMGSVATAQEDIDGAADHPLVGRYEGSVITFHQVKGYEETVMPRAALTFKDKENLAPKSASVAGKLTSIKYEGPADRSALEVLRNYQAALEGRGFTTVFTCRQKECGHAATFWEAARGEIGMPTFWDTNIYALMKLDRPEGTVWASVFAVETKARPGKPLTPYIALRVMEERPIETGKIALVRADALAEKIGIDGRIALYGIEFDYDSDAVKGSSAPQIAEVAAFLKDNPQATVLVVGHTDATGAFDYNRDLSERRAAAVVAKLSDDHGIDADRLFAVGVGPASPVATNRTEAGRARNRRVEIVDLPAAE